MTTVNIQGYEVEVTVLSSSPGCQPYRKGHPDNWSPGEPAEIEFEFATDNELLNTLLTENCYKEAETQLLVHMET